MVHVVKCLPASDMKNDSKVLLWFWRICAISAILLFWYPLSVPGVQVLCYVGFGDYVRREFAEASGFFVLVVVGGVLDMAMMVGLFYIFKSLFKLLNRREARKTRHTDFE